MNPVDITLYAIADPDHCRNRDLADLARDAMAGGASLVQYRDKTSPTREMVTRARRITEALEGSGVPLIINDRIDVALAVGAAGVHLGQDDMAVADARSLFGPATIIGLSVKTVEEARDVPADLVDYVFVGGVFDTSSKDNPAGIGLAGWSERAAIVRARAPTLPVGAIAGIDADNVAELIAAGADGVAMISALFMADDVEDATRVIRQRIGHAREMAGVRAAGAA